MLPIGLITSTIGALKLRASHTPNKASIDLLSVAYSILAFGGLVYGLSSFAEAARGEAAVSPWLLVALGAGFMALFVARQIKLTKTNRALLNLQTFKAGNFRIGIALMLISMLVMFGFMILLPIYMQDGLGMSAMTAGFVLLPGGLAMGLLSPVIGALYDKFGARKLLIPASFVVAALLWYMTTFNAETNFWQLLITYLLFMLAIGFFFTPVFSMTMGAVAPELYPHASATVGSLQQVGGAAGTAIFVTAFTLAIASGGGSVSAGTVAGTQQAFILGAIFWMATIVVALFIREERKSADAGELAQSSQTIH
jgi:DHA2 family lincomycin resistance protein-like MFS transporter